MPPLPRHPSLILAALGLVACAAPRLSAQNPSGTDAVTSACRGRTDGRNCGWRFLPEFAAFLGSGGGDWQVGYRMGIGLGGTVPMGSRSAVGGSVWVLAHDDVSASVLGRYRHWSHRNVVWDVAVGTYLGGGMNAYPMQVPSLIGEVGVSFKDWVGLTARVEHLTMSRTIQADEFADPTRETFTDTVFLIGAKVGRGLGILGYGAAAVAVVAAAVTCCD